MHADSGRFLLDILNSVSKERLLFGFWFVLLCVFLGLFFGFYRQRTRRNFREGSQENPSKSLLDKNNLR